MKFLQDLHVRDVLRGGAQALSLKVVATLAGFFVSVTLGRFYGPEGVGVYALMVTTLMMAATLATAGLDNAVVKFVSGDIAIDDKDTASSTLKTATLMVLISSIFTAIFIYFARDFVSTYILGNSRISPLLGIASASIICIALIRISAAGLKALGNIPAAHIADGVAIPAGVLIVFFLSSGDSIERAAFSYFSGTLVAVIIGLGALVFTSRTKGLSNISLNIQIAKRLWKVAWPTLGIVLGFAATEVLSTVMLSHFSTMEEVGLFRVAWQVAFLVCFLTMATDSIMSPKISGLYVKREISTLAKVLRFNVLLIAFFSIPTAFIIIFLSPFILSFFGDGFQNSIPLLTILVFGQIINGTLGTAGKVLIMTGHERKSFLNSLAGVVVIVVSSWILVPKYGGVGAAMAVSITQTARCLSAMMLVRIYLGINMLTGKAYKEYLEFDND